MFDLQRLIWGFLCSRFCVEVCSCLEPLAIEDNQSYIPSTTPFFCTLFPLVFCPVLSWFFHPAHQYYMMYRDQNVFPSVLYTAHLCSQPSRSHHQPHADGTVRRNPTIKISRATRVSEQWNASLDREITNTNELRHLDEFLGNQVRRRLHFGIL